MAVDSQTGLVIGSFAFGLAALAVTQLWPTERWIGWVSLGGAFVLLLFLAPHEWTYRLLGVVLLGFLGLAAAQYRRDHRNDDEAITVVRNVALPSIVFGEPAQEFVKYRRLLPGVMYVYIESIRIPFMNDPIIRTEEATAKSVHPTLTFFTREGLVEVPGSVVAGRVRRRRLAFRIRGRLTCPPIREPSS
jgi:hypothetical protein